MLTAWDSAVALIVSQGETNATGRQLLALAVAAAGRIERFRVAPVAREAPQIVVCLGKAPTTAVVPAPWGGLAFEPRATASA